MRSGGWDTLGDKATQILTVQEHVFLRTCTAYTAFAHKVIGRHREKTKAPWEEKVAKTLCEGRKEESTGNILRKKCRKNRGNMERERGYCDQRCLVF